MKKFLSSEFGKGAFVLFITINIFNFLNFIFHFSMGRLLGPADYGVLVVLMSIVYLFSIPTETIQNLISRYTSKFNVKNEHGKIKFMMKKSLGKVFKVSFWVFVVAVLISFPLASFLRINFWLLLIVDILILYSFAEPVLRGVLQGRKRFGMLGISMILESTFKLLFSISFVIFGINVFGAILGVVLGGVASFAFTLFFNRDILKNKEEKTSFDKIQQTSIPYIVSMFVIFLILSTDIILAKRFFSAETAGMYAVLSILGKIIFFGTFAISKAMFPLTSERHDINKDSSQLFKKSLLLVFIMCLVAVFAYLIIPELIIWILYGNQYTSVANLLIYSAIAFSFLSLSNVIIVYALSINKITNYFYLPIFFIIQITLLFIFHNTLFEYILAFMVSTIIMFIGTLFFLKK